jgi:transcriptional regulator with XRE-family HTH domain
MSKKNTIAAIRIREEMKEKSLSGADLAALAKLPYYAIENILSGKSNKLDKLKAVAKSLDKPLMYFIDADHGNNIKKNFSSEYDGELHYKVVKIINDLCKKDKIYLTKDRMDKLVDFVYPRLRKDDPEKLIHLQTEAMVNYALKTILK